MRGRSTGVGNLADAELLRRGGIYCLEVTQSSGTCELTVEQPNPLDDLGGSVIGNPATGSGTRMPSRMGVVAAYGPGSGDPRSSSARPTAPAVLGVPPAPPPPCGWLPLRIRPPHMCQDIARGLKEETACLAPRSHFVR